MAYKCYHCGNYFNNMLALKQHKQRIHLYEIQKHQRMRLYDEQRKQKNEQRGKK